MNTKELGLTITTSLWSAGFFGALSYAFTRSAFDIPLLIAVSVAAIVEATLVTASLGFVRDKVLRVFVCTVPPLMLALTGFLSVGASVGAVLLLFFLWSAYKSIAWEMNNRLHLQLWPMFSSTARLVTLGVLLGSIGLGYPWLLRQIQSGSVHVAPTSLSGVVKPIEPFLRSAIPGYTSDMTIDQVISSQVNQAAEKAAGTEPVPPTDQQHQAAIVQLQQQFGTNVQGSDSITSLAAGAINRQLTNLTSRFPLVVTLLVIVVLFLTLRTLIPFLVIPVLGFLWILVWLGRQTGYVQLVTETHEVEKLIL